MTERVQRAREFLLGLYDSCEFFKANPSDRKYRWEHSLRVACICRDIARAEGMDEELAEIAGLLHDVGYGQDFPADYEWKNHGRDGARMARPFLKQLGLDEETVNDICYAIAIHVDDRADFEGRRTPFTETVGDADNIDRFDAYRIYEFVRYQMVPEEHDLSENLAWLHQRLARLKELSGADLATLTATKLWREKVAFQTQYFSRLLAQMETSK